MQTYPSPARPARNLLRLSLIAGATFNQLMAIITQGSLAKMREKMFNGMQDLPIKYFDTHNHGDVMSYYTNDIDTLRQMISQSIPQLIISTVTVLTVLAIMLYFSVWMTLVVLVGVFFMVLVTKKVGGRSSKYFIRMQQSIAATEGVVEEMMRCSATKRRPRRTSTRSTTSCSTTPSRPTSTPTCLCPS